MMMYDDSINVIWRRNKWCLRKNWR